MALLSNNSLKSLDIYQSLNVDEYTKDAIKIYDLEILDGILCEEIMFLNTPDGFFVSFSSTNAKLFEEADYYFDSENNDDLTKQMDKLYKENRAKRKFRDKIDNLDVNITVSNQGSSISANLTFKQID